MKPEAQGVTPPGERRSSFGGVPGSLVAIAVAVGFAGIAPASLAAVIAADTADNDPYPITNWQVGDNGGYGFQPWSALERGTPGSRYVTGWILQGHRHAWGFSGTYAFGRGLGSQLNAGTLRMVALHGPESGSFSGFNLKGSTQPGLAAGELLRFGIDPGIPNYDSGIIHVSTNSGTNYLALDCGWPVGLGDAIEYSVTWSAAGAWWLGVSNLSARVSTRFAGTMSSGSVAMLGATSSGATLSEGFTFDRLVLESEPDIVPWLTIRLYPGDRVALWWPAPAYGWYLQQTLSLPSTNWSKVTQPPQPVAEGWQVVLPVGRPPSTMFFRLKK